MTANIFKCSGCGKYTLSECCAELENSRPAKYSPEDKYAKYRRQVKYEDVGSN